GLFDCCPTTDGAAAVVVCRADLARSFTGMPVWPLGIGLAAVSGQPYYKPSFGYVGFEATVRAAEQAYTQAKLTPPQVDFAEVHDCFTITEILNYEDLGFCARGEGGRFVEEGRADLGGEKPVNPSGGLKSYGHPVGATGVRMLYELATQLRGQAGARQVKGAKIGLAAAASPEERRANLARGLALAEEAVAADERDAKAHFAVFCNLGNDVKLRGVAVMSLFAVRRLRREIDRTLELAPDYADALVGKGEFLCELPRLLGGDAAEGERLLRAALRVDPGFIEAHLGLARALAARGERDEARAEARRAVVEAEPAHAP